MVNVVLDLNCIILKSGYHTGRNYKINLFLFKKLRIPRNLVCRTYSIKHQNSIVNNYTM